MAMRWMRVGDFIMAMKNARAANGAKVSTCRNLTPAINRIRNDKSAMSAAVPKSSMIIRPATSAMSEQIGRNLFRYKYMESLKLEQNAARKKIIDHFANSEG